MAAIAIGRYAGAAPSALKPLPSGGTMQLALEQRPSAVKPMQLDSFPSPVGPMPTLQAMQQVAIGRQSNAAGSNSFAGGSYAKSVRRELSCHWGSEQRFREQCHRDRQSPSQAPMPLLSTAIAIGAGATAQANATALLIGQKANRSQWHRQSTAIGSCRHSKWRCDCSRTACAQANGSLCENASGYQANGYSSIAKQGGLAANATAKAIAHWLRGCACKLCHRDRQSGLCQWQPCRCLGWTANASNDFALLLEPTPLQKVSSSVALGLRSRSGKSSHSAWFLRHCQWIGINSTASGILCSSSNGTALPPHPVSHCQCIGGQSPNNCDRHKRHGQQLLRHSPRCSNSRKR